MSAAPTAGSRSLAEFLANLHECRDKRSLTHGLHPYPAKFIPHIPRRLIELFSDPGDTVLDPMCGSGTAVIEAAVAGRVGIGSDLNPIACLAARAKTTVLTDDDERQLARLHGRLEGLAAAAASATGPGRPDIGAVPPEFTNRDHWFDPHVVVELSACLDEIRRLAEGSGARAVAVCAFSAVVVAVSRQESETRWVARPVHVLPGATAKRLAGQISAAVPRLRAYARSAAGTVRILRADARHLPLPAGSVDLVVTSPPYANSHDYYLYHKLRMFWLGHDVGPVQETEFGSRNKHSDLKLGIDHYLASMRSVFTEVARVLRGRGTAAVVVGDAVIRGAFYDMAESLIPVAAGAGLATVDSQAFSHKRFTAAFNARFGTDRDKRTHVIILRRA